ncbi:MAG: oxidoreductase [Betaproteobacteria bacterium]|nr:oxidoreductase [Betaproteobacteria bacterium]
MRALMLEKDAAGAFSASVKQVDSTALPAGDVQVAVEYSSINYKDGLAITQKGPVVRSWPMVAGIDGAGVVTSSQHPDLKPGDRVVHNGWGLGETRWGCLSERASLQGDWLVKLPDSISNRQAMAIGTAGYTAMLCVMALQDRGVQPEAGEVLVTGATGGVGSVAVALLAQAGYTVTAATGKMQETEYLKGLGAAQVIDRAELASPGRPLQKERWAAVVDAVGSHTLVNALAQTRYGGVVAACGLAQGGDLQGSVMPFILRGVSLVGVDSVMAPLAVRRRAWERLAAELDPQRLDRMVTEVSLDGAVDAAHRLMDGQVRGRVVVRVTRARPVSRLQVHH